MSGTDNLNFDIISDFISKLRFSIKKSTLANIDRNEVEDAKKKKAKEITDSTKFVESPDPIEQEIVDDLFKELEHKKTKHSYVELQVKDAQTVETETQATKSEFSKLKQKFDKVNNAATEQKSQTDAINLSDNILDEDNP